MEKETHTTNTYTQPLCKASEKSEILLHAQPYDISANGFYFHNFEEYQQKSSTLRNDYGAPVEEFEIQFIDGDDLDCALFKALDIHQGNFDAFFTACEEWNEDQKIKVIIAVGEAGYSFDPRKDDPDDPDDFDIELYELDSLRDLAEQFIEEGLFGEIPENIRFYLDYDAIARDLGMDYSEIRLNDTNYIYRCS
ncbi:MAG: antirestriction protein ArdA [Alphaproteobacteria bacterium]|nr:antirestriction protein ArdA [Alphaproteobacteria bacterium]